MFAATLGYMSFSLKNKNQMLKNAFPLVLNKHARNQNALWWCSNTPKWPLFHKTIPTKIILCYFHWEANSLKLANSQIILCKLLSCLKAAQVEQHKRLTLVWYTHHRVPESICWPGQKCYWQVSLWSPPLQTASTCPVKDMWRDLGNERQDASCLSVIPGSYYFNKLQAMTSCGFTVWLLLVRTHWFLWAKSRGHYIQVLLWALWWEKKLCGFWRLPVFLTCGLFLLK